MSAIQIVNVAPNIPAPIRFLETLARNAWWSWNQDAISLLRRIDPSLWRECGANPLEFLRRLPQNTLESLAADTSFQQHLSRLEAHFTEATAKAKGSQTGDVAYFSLEFGLHETIRLYSGGLGILAGDHLKAASDSGVPLYGVGIFYSQGYFEQRLTQDGWQQEQYINSEIENMPMKRARTPAGELFEVSIHLPEGLLTARVWVLSVGGIPLVLLDANVPENPPEFREITARLYGGGHVNRLRQELLLAIGGFRALIAMGIEPEVCHMNEGHAAFLSLARIEHLMKSRKLDLDSAYEICSRSNVFTTHTPVPAGNETFPIPLVEAHLKALEPETGVPPYRVIQWGRAPGDTTGELSMTILGLRFAQLANGVSALHGEVARGMWRHVWPGRVREEIPIGHVTNGVHASTWLSPEISVIIEQHLGPDWQRSIQDPKNLARILDIPDEEIWRAHELSRSRLLRAAREAMEKQYGLHNATRSEMAFAKSVLDPNVLTIGFARRAASYKRATLLLRNPDRLEALLNHTERPIQIIFAGKAHPADDGGKDFIRQLVHFSRRLNTRRRLIFIENYDIKLARSLVQGADIWLNTPRRRVEASGTSGMKAAMNGVLNASILDGWWCEGYAPDNGYAIGNGEEYEDDNYADEVESLALYKLIEDDIAPTFYERIKSPDPARWIAMMKESIRMSLGFFTTRRMVEQYRDELYGPAAKAFRDLTADAGAAAKLLVTQRARLQSLWPAVRVSPPKSDSSFGSLYVGDAFKAVVSVFLGDLKPSEVRVELCFGPADSQNQIKKHQFIPMAPGADHKDGWHDFEHEMPCRLSGRYGITARVVPAGLTWEKVSPGFVTWASPV